MGFKSLGSNRPVLTHFFGPIYCILVLMNGIGDCPQFVRSILCESEVMEGSHRFTPFNAYAQKRLVCFDCVVYNINLTFVGPQVIDE
jgi:hypothetical protein